MAGGNVGKDRGLAMTPTWAVALVCAVIVLISILLEKFLHAIGEFFHERHKKPLYEALEKIKGELMVLGFISLLLTFGQSYIANICIPEEHANHMLPCPMAKQENNDTESPGGGGDGAEHHRRLLWYEHRILSESAETVSCEAGKVPLISMGGLHQLHIFIFFLALFHVLFSALVMTLGRLKIRGWKYWEREIVDEYALFNDPTRFRLTHETSFVKGNTSSWTKNVFLFYTVCFFRQFFRSVRKSDYLTLRHGFISVHLAPGSKFNFQKYIKRSLEDDFKVVVGISPVLWTSAIIYLLLNVDEWQAMLWLSLMPLIVILALGTKLQAIIAQMALEIQERHVVVQGIPLVQVSDKHFWFSWPKLVLHLIHLTLFQNAFEITYFIWTTYEFGLFSCFHENFIVTVVRVVLGVGAQCLCSYITLPLYALVTQMGSTMKQSIFDEQTSKALKNWHKSAMQKKNEGKPGPAVAQSLEGSPLPQSVVPQNCHSGESRVDMTSLQAQSPQQGGTANIIASVDITDEPPSHPQSGGPPDLLT